MNLLIKAFKYPQKVVMKLARFGFLNNLSDEKYIKFLYWLTFHRKIDLYYPKTYNEKLNWIKLYDHNPEYCALVDKYKCKDIVKQRIGDQYNIKTIGIYNSIQEIDFSKLPQAFVIKSTIGSGDVFFVKDKACVNYKKVKKRFTNAIKRNYFYVGREWPYKNNKPRIMIEEMLNLDAGDCLTDYKFFCFNGHPTIMYIGTDQSKKPHADYFDMDFNHLKIHGRDPNSKIPPNKPSCFDEMKNLARILSSGLPEARIDFYYVNGQIYVGEITLFHNCGFGRFYPSVWDRKLGDLLTLPEKRI